MTITVFSCCGSKLEPCDTPECGRRSVGNCQYRIRKMRRNGQLIYTPEGTFCGRPVCRNCAVEVDGVIHCLAHARLLGEGHGS